MNSVFADLRYALRQLRKSPGFAIVAVLALSLGVGAATTVFSVIDAVIIRPLPFANADRIVVPAMIAREGYTQPAAYPSYLDMRAQNTTFADFAGYSDFFSVNLQTPSGPVSLDATKGTDNFFRVFGVAPILGRTFAPGEDQPGRDDVAVLSYDVWRENFDAQKSVIGRVVDLNGHPYTIIGVMPAGFRYPLGRLHAIYTPLHAPEKWVTRRGDHWLRTIGLLKPGVTRQQAEADMARVMANIGRAYPDTDGGRKLELHSLEASVDGEVRGPLGTLVFAVLAVLAIGCVNVAGLLLARGVKREREIAMRAAVGASRSRLIRQMLTESLLLAGLGALGGALIASLLLAAMRTFLVHAVARGSDVHMNVPVLFVALVLSAATAVVPSLAPALRLSGTDPNRALKAGGSAGTGRTQHRIRTGFIVTQVALSLVLLVISALLLASITRSRDTNLGIDPAHIAATPIDLSPGRYQGRDVLTSFYNPLLERVQHLPGVTAAGLVNMTPIRDWGSNSDVHIKGQPPYPPNQEMMAEDRFVSASYFKTMNLALKRGRLFNPSTDTPKSPPVIVVNQAFVKKFIPAGVDPIGQHIDDGNAAIIGVVANVRQDLNEPPMAEMDYWNGELPTSDQQLMLMDARLVFRTEGDPRAVYKSIRQAVHQTDPTVPFYTPETISELVSDQLIFQRMEGWLFGIFAALAVLLAVIGLYGLISHEVELGTRDIGVRMALGATREHVLVGVFRRVSFMLMGGVVAGFALTALASKLIAAVIPIQYSRDAGIFAMLGCGMVAAGLMAAALPARRAAFTEPIEALRHE